MIAWALDHRFAMIALAISTFAGAIALPMYGLIGGGLVPEMDESEFSIAIETPPGANLTVHPSARRRRLPKIARMPKEVRYTYVSIGGQGDEAVDEGTVFVKLTPKSERSRTQAEMVTEIRRGLSQLAGVSSSISTGFNEGEKQIQLQLQGPDAGQLAKLADAVVAEVARCRARLTSDFRRRDRSRSSTCSSIAGLPAASV